MKRWAALVAVWILVACGGGEGGSTGGGVIPPPSGPPSLSVFAGFIRSVSDVDRNQTAARFVNPFGVATDSAGNVYVADWGHHAIRKVTPAGVVSTLAGTGEAGNADGLGLAAQFK